MQNLETGKHKKNMQSQNIPAISNFVAALFSDANDYAKDVAKMSTCHSFGQIA